MNYLITATAILLKAADSDGRAACSQILR